MEQSPKQDEEFIMNKSQLLQQTIKQNFKTLVNVTKFTTLYLLNQYGQFEYLFKDMMQKKYRTKIASTIQCTCHLGNLGHCLHSLYILLRIYKVSYDDQIVYKNSYEENDLEYIKKKGKTIQNFILKQNKIQQIVSKKQDQRQWPSFEKDTVCSVCYDQIQNSTPVIDCLKCHNYFHTKCLKIWVVSKKNEEGTNNSCPMCRSQFEQQIQDRLKGQEHFFVKYHQSHQINCTECGKQILIKLYRCLLCLNTNLCESCYTGWQHKSHDKFIGKLSKRAKWTVTTRSQYNMNRLKASLEYMKTIGSQSDMKQLMGPKYQQFLDSYIKKPTLLEHIINCFLDVEQEVLKKFKKLQFSEKDIMCCMCKKKKIVSMRRLPCGHFIDEKCLKFLLKRGFRECPIDKNYILAGFNGIQLKLQ